MTERVRRGITWGSGTFATGLTGATLVTLVGFLVVDNLTRRFADIPVGRLSSSWLLFDAASARPAIAALLTVALGVLFWRARGRAFLPWTDLAHGRRLQASAGVIMLVVAWRLVAAPRNYLFEQWYLLDRVLLVALVAAAILRPVAVLFVVVQIRLLQAPIREPSFLHPGLNVDELAVLAVVIVGVMVALVLLSARYTSAAAFPVLLAAIGAQFFLPGRTKIRVRWFENDLAHLPLSGYAQGWLGSGDGSFAQSLSEVLDAVEPAVLAATLLFEFGAILIVLRRQVLLGWLLAAVGFHVAVFLSLGFVFFEFVVVELVVAALVWGPSGREWSRPAFAPGPSVIAAIAIVLGPSIFHPPTLAWFDSALSYNYEIDGFDSSGQEWELVAGDFAPYDDTLAFADLALGPTSPLVGAYGAASRVEDELIEGFSSVDDVEAAEEPWDPVTGGEQVELLQSFLVSTHRQTSSAPWFPSAPQHFLTSRPGRSYDSRVPLERLIVERVTTLRTDGGEVIRREHVVTIELRDGEPVVVWL